MSEQITWVSQIVGADYLGLQNAGAEYLGPFFAKSGADYLGRLPSWWGRIPGHRQKWGAEYLGAAKSGAEYLGAAKSGADYLG